MGLRWLEAWQTFFLGMRRYINNDKQRKEVQKHKAKTHSAHLLKKTSHKRWCKQNCTVQKKRETRFKKIVMTEIPDKNINEIYN